MYFASRQSNFIRLTTVLLILNGVESSCNYFQNLEVGQIYYVYTPGFPDQYKGENHCTWQTTSSYITKINCSVNMPMSRDCTQDSVSIQFVKNDIHKYCGFGTFTLEGINATIKFVSSHYSKGGRFLCQVRAEKSLDKTNCKCGWRKPVRVIVGGKETGINEYTMMAGLVDSIKRILYCGATIISDTYVITAAHCVENKYISTIGVIVGEHDETKGNETNVTKLYRIKKCTIHPDYYDVHNDIAVCKIIGTIEYSAQIGPVCLPFEHRRDLFSGSIVTALGWGLLEFGGIKSKTLQEVKLNVINLRKCKYYFPKITDSNICTYTPGKDSCQMDSGGPILWQNPTTNNLVLIGIISAGVGCASKEPAIEIRTGAFIDWIVSVTPDAQYCKAE